MKLASCAPIVAAMSSSSESVSVFNGATRDLAITMEVKMLCRRRATAPYATLLASAKTCSSTRSCGFTGTGKYCR